MPVPRSRPPYAAIALALVLGLGITVGIALEYKTGLLAKARERLSAQPLLTPLAIQTSTALIRPSIDPIDPITAGAGAPPNPLDDWQATTRDRILSLGGSAVVVEEQRSIAYRILEERRLPGNLRQQLIAFLSFDGSEIPAYLHLPPEARPAPGILVIPGHVREGDSGIEQLANDDGSYQHAAARRLAEQGYVTLTPELRGFGYLGKPLNTEHTLIAYAAILSGTSYKWVTLRDIGQAMALLRQHPAVDSARIAVAGASLGGELAVQYSALDTRVSAVAFHAYAGGRGTKGPITGGRDDQPHYCHVLPRIDRIVAQEHWFWLLAPRPVLGVRGAANNPFDDQDRALYGQPWKDAQWPALALQTAEGGHEFFVEPTIAFFAQVFQSTTP